MKKVINAMSLFANVGIAETYLNETNINVILANEIDSERVKFYKHLYPDVNVIEGDITDVSIKNKLIKEAIDNHIDFIMATPPCQGMSTAGKKSSTDSRNLLICDAIEIVKIVKPSFVLFENVPEQLKTKIKVNGKDILIPDFIYKELGDDYYIENEIIDSADYGVAQNRLRAFFLLSKKSSGKKWRFPEKENYKRTMLDAIGELPILDPFIRDISIKEMNEIFPLYEKRKEEALKISKWHKPPTHVYRQVFAMMHTPTGESAFTNIDKFKPKKVNGEIVKGYNNTYKRQNWDKPGYTITMYNRTIGSQNNVHPGRLIGKDNDGYDLYSDPRVLTIFELMRVMSLPDDWNIPENFSDNFIRSVIGEGIPPLLIKKIVEVMPIEKN